MKNLNNRVLIGILAGIILAFTLSKIFRSSRMQRSMPEAIVQLDTATIDAIQVFPSVAFGGKLEFTKENKQWTIIKEKKEAKVEQGSVSNMLSNVVKLIPQKLVTRKKEKWNQYAVGDSSSRVIFLKDGKVLADLRIGRTQFNPTSGAQNPYGMGGFGSSFTYVRLNDEDEVYSVDGFLETTFNRSFDDWRDKSFLRLKAEEITRIHFDYPDSGFVAEKKEGRWMVGDIVADSTEMKNYLNQLAFKNAIVFADDFRASKNPDLTLRFEGKSGMLAIVKGWKRETDFVLNTSRQPEVYFSSASSALMNTLFERKVRLQGKK